MQVENEECINVESVFKWMNPGEISLDAHAEDIYFDDDVGRQTGWTLEQYKKRTFPKFVKVTWMPCNE
jgi:hypothetical protein